MAGGDTYISREIHIEGTLEADRVTASTINFSDKNGNVNVNGELTVHGGTTLHDDLTVQGDLTVMGSTTALVSTTTVLEDPILTLGIGTESTDAKDRGIEFRYGDGTAVQTGFFGWDRSANRFVLLKQATNDNETFTGTLGNIHADTFEGTLSGNASTTTALATARVINGTSFDGTADITTANWGTSRTITIGSTGKSVNGSDDVNWSLSEIGVNDSTLTLATSGIASGDQTWTSNQGNHATFTVDVPGTDLGYTAGATDGTITSTTGDNATVPSATQILAGLMTADDKEKLDGIEAGAQVNDASISAASATEAGVVTTDDQTLAGTKTLFGSLFFKGDTRYIGTSSNNHFYIRTNNTDRIRILSGGQVGINMTPNTSFQLDVSGAIRASGDITAFSDGRYKTDVETVQNALDKVDGMRGVTYRMKEDGSRKQVGLIAQDVERVVPEAVVTDTSKEQRKSVAYGNLVGVLVEAIKELRTTVHRLEERVKSLEK